MQLSRTNAKKPIVYFGRITESKGIKLIIFSIYELFKQNFDHLSPLWIIGGNYLEINNLRKEKDIKNPVAELERHNLLFLVGACPS